MIRRVFVYSIVSLNKGQLSCSELPFYSCWSFLSPWVKKLHVTCNLPWLQFQGQHIVWPLLEGLSQLTLGNAWLMQFKYLWKWQRLLVIMPLQFQGQKSVTKLSLCLNQMTISDTDNAVHWFCFLGINITTS